jgi:murein DD-endopeptidase MepM/ murein hydrolase activator NlpD
LSPKDIAPFNQLSLDKGLSIGQLIKIPLIETNFDQQSTARIGIPVVHKVQPKEGLYRIAENYHVSMSILKGWNNINSEQVKIGDKLIVGFLKQSGKSEEVAAIAPPKKYEQTERTTIVSPAQEKQTVNTPSKEKLNAVAKESPKQEELKKEVTEKYPSSELQSKSISNANEPMGTGFFSTLYNQQASGGKEQHLEAFIYGTFKSTSGWDDQKYYILLNDVTPGTAVKISIKGSDRTVYAKVLGAVPPGKESEGLSMRMSSATAVALGITDTNAQLQLDWYK